MNSTQYNKWEYHLILISLLGSRPNSTSNTVISFLTTAPHITSIASYKREEHRYEVCYFINRSNLYFYVSN
jgi:hypothetical protein